MGYWLTEATSDNHPGPPEALELRIDAPGEPTPIETEPAVTPVPGLERSARTVHLKGPDGDLVLTLGPRIARAVASPATWDALAEPVLLVVCQYWRLQAIDADLDRLTIQAEGDLGHAAMAVPSSMKHRRRLLSNARDIRAILLDLPHFAGPLTDPLPYLSTERAVAAYERLAEKLRLDAWSESIDERAEAVEDTYGSVTEKLNEFRNFAVGSILEIIIVVILLADLGLHIYQDYFE